MEKENKGKPEIAGRIFETSDYGKNDTLSSGLATTHEQAMDAYTEGEVGETMENVNGKDIPMNGNK